MGRKLGEGYAPLGKGEVGPHLTQCGQDRRLAVCQVSSWSIQPFGHSTPTLHTDRTDRTDRTDVQDRQTGQRSESSDGIGWTVLQTVAQNGSLYAIGPLSVALLHCEMPMMWKGGKIIEAADSKPNTRERMSRGHGCWGRRGWVRPTLWNPGQNETLWVKKGCHPYHGYNFVNSWSLCKILSLL